MVRRLVVVLLLAAPVFAQTKPKENPAPTQPPKAQNLIFGESDVIEGTLDQPDLGVTYGRPPPKFNSMIQVRMNFDDKLRDSVGKM